MKSIGNFLIGSLTSLGVSAALPESANVAQTVTSGSNLIDSIEALISLVSGILSAMLVAWLKRKWEQKKVG